MGSSDWHKGVRACAQAFGGVRHPRKAESDVLEPMQNYFHRVIYNLCTGSPGYASDDESDDAHIPASPRTVRKVKFRAAASVPLSQSLMRRWGRPAGPLPNNQCRPVPPQGLMPRPGPAAGDPYEHAARRHQLPIVRGLEGSRTGS